MVDYLSGNVDGSYAGAAGVLDLDVTQPGCIAPLFGSLWRILVAKRCKSVPMEGESCSDVFAK